MPGTERTDPIKVLMVTKNLDAGGVEGVILTYAKAMKPPRFAVTVVCIEPGQVFKEISSLPGVQSYCIGSSSRIKRFLGILEIARATRPHVVHNHASWYGLLVGTLVGAKRVETVHNVYHWLTWSQQIHYGLYCRLADRVIAVSEVVKRYTLDHLPFFQSGNFQVIHNGVDLAAFQSTSGTMTPPENGDADRNPLVGFIGRLTEQKGVEYLLDAAALLLSRRILHRLVIVGDGPLRPQLEAKAASLNLTNVTFVGYRRDISGLLQSFDLFVLPSLWEGLPVSLLEAMASGCPVVASRVGGSEEAVLDGTTGYLVAPRDVEALADRMAKLMAAPALREQMRIAAKLRVREHFSASAMVEQTACVYNEILAER
jgi:glycosyltransferase involved in cell wall biosynthesis